MKILDKIKKSKIVRYTALACAGLSCLYSAPSFAEKNSQVNNLSKIIDNDTHTHTHTQNIHTLIGPETNKPTPNFLKFSKTKTIEDEFDNPSNNYTPYTTEEARKLNKGNIQGFVTLDDLIPQVNKNNLLSSVNERSNIPLNILVGYALTVGWHEFGHCVVGNIAGYRNVTMHGPGKGVIASVHTSYGENIKSKRTAFYLGGVGFTTIGNIALESLLNTNNVPKSLRSFVATTALFMLFDRHRYLWFTAIKSFSGMKINDMNDIKQVVDTNLGHEKNNNTIYGVALAASALELYLRKDDIWNLVKIAVGKETNLPKGNSDIELGTYFSNNGLFFGARGKW